MDLPSDHSTPPDNTTDPQQIANALRASEARFRAIFEQAMVGVAEYDLDGKHIFVNTTYRQSLGFSSQEILGLSLEDIVHPDDYPHCRHLFERAKHEKKSFLGEKRFKRKDGQFLWNADSICGLCDPQTGQTQSVVAVCIDITNRKNTEAALQRSYEWLERRVQERTQELSHALDHQKRTEAARLELVKRIVATQEEERGRISRELHDNMGQHLTGLMLGLQVLEMQIEKVTGATRLTQIPQLSVLRSQVNELMRVAHEQARSLRPAELDALGLEAALNQYISDWSQRTGVCVDFQTVGDHERPSLEIETTLYRVVQEALTNVLRHAQATQVSIVLKHSGDHMSVIVEDNGLGFDSEQSTNRLGLLGMQERLAIVRGTLDIESSPGNGTTIFARVPR